jgi:xanthine/CO dehydrogenase XdhC/CoxF family maturation factor
MIRRLLTILFRKEIDEAVAALVENRVAQVIAERDRLAELIRMRESAAASPRAQMVFNDDGGAVEYESSSPSWT